MINSKQTGVFVRDPEFPGQTDRSSGISLWYAANSGYTVYGPTDCNEIKAELPADVDPDLVFVSMYSICAAPFNGGIFSYWTRNHDEQTVINIATSPFHSRELRSILDERYPDACKATRLSLALVIDICDYALQHLIPHIDLETSTAQLSNIKSATLAVLAYAAQHFTVPKAYPVTSYANVTYSAKYRLSKAMCIGDQNKIPAAVACTDQEQPYLPGFEPETTSTQASTHTLADTVLPAELVPEETVLEELVRSSTGNKIKDAELPTHTRHVSELPHPAVSNMPKFEVSLVITKCVGDGSGAELLTPVVDAGLVPRSFTVSDSGTAEVKVRASLSSISALLNSLKA